MADVGTPVWLQQWLTEHGDDLVAWRRRLHRHPELGHREHLTTGFVHDTLTAAGLTPRLLPGTGLTCDIGDEGPLVALRADLDALPLHERTGLPFASEVPGAMHACGHDVHTAALLGAGLALASAGPLPGRVRLIFQPAEEIMTGGAVSVIAAGALDGVSRIFAVHCDPRLQVGSVGVKVGALTYAADDLTIRLQSPGGHTSRPHLTGDLVHALGTLVTGLPSVLSRRVDPRSGTVLTWGMAQAGEAPNAIPQTGVLRGTVRTGNRETWALLRPLIADATRDLLAPFGVTHELIHDRGVPPVVNDRTSARLLRTAVVAGLGESAVATTEQSSGGEDFAWYLEKVPGAMARLGVWPGHGPQLDLHQPTFDADERALDAGVRLLVHAALATWTPRG